ncbi:MAG: Asp-tRNA(Asn)/Glu-tRNA(Gln) amidotransferase subunit GatC [Planctomycetaceae bacterium]
MTAPLTTNDVAKVADLARLKLSDEEVQRLAKEMASILEYVEVLNEVSTDDVQPMAHAVDVVNVLRDDDIADSLPREAALANAPKSDGECFLVPQILDGV